MSKDQKKTRKDIENNKEDNKNVKSSKSRNKSTRDSKGSGGSSKNNTSKRKGTGRVQQKKDERDKSKAPVQNKEENKSDNPVTENDKKRTNHWSWYAADESILRDSASFSYNTPIGVNVDWGLPTGYKLNSRLKTLPGVMVLPYLPVPGEANGDRTDAVNIAAQNLYTYVRHVNSGSRNYEPSDLMMYVLAMDGIYCGLEYIRRAYGIERVYSIKNRYLGQYLNRVSGVNDMTSQLVNYRTMYNLMVKRIGALCVPNSFPILKRHSWMTSMIFADAQTAKAQLYVYRPYALPKWSPRTSETGSSLQYVALQGGTISDFEEVLTGMLDAILSDEDCGVMSGDILKAFGDSGVVKLESLSEDYTVEPVVDYSVLSQIQNTVTVPLTMEAGGPIVVQVSDTTGLASYIQFSFPLNSSTCIGGAAGLAKAIPSDYDINKILTVYTEVPEPKDTMVASRNMVTIKSEHGSTFDSADFIFGTELFVGLEIYTDPSDYALTTRLTTQTIIRVELNESNTTNLFNLASLHTKFACAPSIYVFATSQVEANVFYQLIGDLDNYTIIAPVNMHNMHTAATLNEYSVPLMGAFSNKTGKGLS